jgi:hypothetical protein
MCEGFTVPVFLYLIREIKQQLVPRLHNMRLHSEVLEELGETGDNNTSTVARS